MQNWMIGNLGVVSNSSASPSEITFVSKLELLPINQLCEVFKNILTKDSHPDCLTDLCFLQKKHKKSRRVQRAYSHENSGEYIDISRFASHSEKKCTFVL